MSAAESWVVLAGVVVAGVAIALALAYWAGRDDWDERPRGGPRGGGV